MTIDADKSKVSLYLKLLKRFSFDGVDIISKGEKPKSKHFILIKDIPAILDAIKTQEEKDVIALIAKKLRTSTV